MDQLDRFFRLTVGDLIGPKIVTIEHYQTMCEAAQILAANDISGAPVVDESGKCIGIITAHDFVQFQSEAAGCGGGLHTRKFDLIDSDSPDGTQIIENPADRVYRNMSAGVQTVAQSELIHEVAKIMCLEHIHHLVVLDEYERPAGLITSLDLVAALWNLRISSQACSKP
jgi:predicted transcriptional regulator